MRSASGFALDSLQEGAGLEPSVPLEVLTVGIVPCRLRGPFHAYLPKTKFAADSALEGDGFEPSVPPATASFVVGPPTARCCEGQAAAKSALRFSPIFSARQAIPSSRGRTRLWRVAVCRAAWPLLRTGGTTQIYLRS